MTVFNKTEIFAKAARRSSVKAEGSHYYAAPRYCPSERIRQPRVCPLFLSLCSS